MSDQPVSIADAIARVEAPWQPQDLAVANDSVVRFERTKPT